MLTKYKVLLIYNRPSTLIFNRHGKIPESVRPRMDEIPHSIFLGPDSQESSFVLQGYQLEHLNASVATGFLTFTMLPLLSKARIESAGFSSAGFVLACEWCYAELLEKVSRKRRKLASLREDVRANSGRNCEERNEKLQSNSHFGEEVVRWKG